MTLTPVYTKRFKKGLDLMIRRGKDGSRYPDEELLARIMERTAG